MSRRENGTACKSLILLGTGLQNMRHEMRLRALTYNDFLRKAKQIIDLQGDRMFLSPTG
jgi:hypothetical protein